MITNLRVDLRLTGDLPVMLHSSRLVMAACRKNGRQREIPGSAFRGVSEGGDTSEINEITAAAAAAPSEGWIEARLETPEHGDGGDVEGGCLARAPSSQPEYVNFLSNGHLENCFAIQTGLN